MTREEFIQCLERGEIPPSPPHNLNTFRSYENRVVDFRGEATERGMWALVYVSMAKDIAHWLNGRNVLEVMAGRGWLAKALTQQGVDIVATDDNSWDDRHSKSKNVHPVIKMDCLEAVRQFGKGRDVLIMSWPYMNDLAYWTIRKWGSKKDILYIGEGRGGCTANDYFFDCFDLDYTHTIYLESWRGIRDQILIGRYTE